MTNDSVLKHRKKRVEEGYRNISVLLSPEATAALEKIQEMSALSQKNAISKALIFYIENFGKESTDDNPNNIDRISKIEEEIFKISAKLDFLCKNNNKIPVEKIIKPVETENTTSENKNLEEVMLLAGEILSDKPNISFGKLHKILLEKGCTYYSTSQALSRGVTRYGGRDVIIEKAKGKKTLTGEEQ